ncbi:thymidylate kinase [Patescibacteria group bacterium]|nr:thymidylate kinase [Patescibacteria group bacterium]
MKKGTFFVIDGTDGSGKATQTRLLVKHLLSDGFLVETISFPQYGKKSAGLAEEYLSGKYGSANDVGPYKASVLYAVDRFDGAFQIKQWLDDGKIVVADRYVGSNLGHQGTKIDSDAERKKFFDWGMEFEHEFMGIPKPDVNIILHVDSKTAMRLLHERSDNKHGGETDIHEKDPQHMKKAESVYMELTELYSEFKSIECVEQQTLLTPEQIHEKVWNLVQNYL